MDAPDVKPPVGPVFGGGEAETTAQQQQQSTAPSRKRASFSRVVPEQGKKRVNYGKGDARRIMEEAVSLCEAMTLGYEVVFHGRRRSYAAHRPGGIDGVRGLSAEPTDSSRREDADGNLEDSEVAYIARSKRDVAEQFGVAWSTMQPRLVGKIGPKPSTPSRTVSMPEGVESELYQHVLWMCENGYPVTWEDVKAMACQLGSICGVQDFAASNQWMKRFKIRFPNLEMRYSPQLRSSQGISKRGPGDSGWVDERSNGSEIASPWAEAGVSTSVPPMSSCVSNDMQALTVGSYLATQRSKFKAETEAIRRQQQTGILPEAVATASSAHHDPRLRLPHGSVMANLPPHLLGHAYNGGQLQVTPHYPPGLFESSPRGGVRSLWSHTGTGMIVGHEELQQQQQQHHLGLALQQVGPMGLGGQRIMSMAGQHLASGGGLSGLPPSHLDSSGIHHHAIGAQPTRSQGLTPMAHFSGMTGQSMVMGLGAGGHLPQVTSGGPGMVMYPAVSVGTSGRMVPSSQVGHGHPVGMVGPWQPPAGWPEHPISPWQHTSMPQAQGPQQQQQQLQHLISPQGQGIYQAYPSSLDHEDCKGGLSSSVGLSQQAMLGHPPCTSRHDYFSPVGLALGQHQQTLPLAFGMGDHSPATSLLNGRQPKHEDGHEGESRAEKAQREQEPKQEQQGSAQSAGELKSNTGGNGGREVNGGGEDSSNRDGVNSPSNLSARMDGPVRGSPRGSSITNAATATAYPAHLAGTGMAIMRTGMATDGDVNGTSAPCSSLSAVPSSSPSSRSKSGSGGGGMEPDGSGSSSAPRREEEPVKSPHPQGTSPTTESSRNGSMGGGRCAQLEDEKARRWGETYGANTVGAGRAVIVGGGGRGGSNERID